MKTIILKVDNPDWYVPQILEANGYGTLIPTNTIINKRIPGIGATRGEIDANRHSIIIEPFITVIETKKVYHGSNICVVYGSSIDDLTTYLTDPNIKFKKIVTTPESLKRVLRILKKDQPNYRNDYFMLIDECEKLIQTALFRDKIFEPIEEFFLFKNKAMISATPLIPSHDKFAEKGFIILDLVPTFDYQVPIKIIATNNVRITLRNVVEILSFKKDNNPVFLFTNCKKSILYFSKLNQVHGNMKIFCAEELDKKFFSINKTPTFQTVKDQSYAGYNAFTGRFFAAVDMMVQKPPHIIILTNIPFVEHSTIDPSTDAVQIWGRARKEMNQPCTITHITNFYYGQEPTTKEQIKIDTEKEIYFVNRLKQLQGSTRVKEAAKSILSFIDKEHVFAAYDELGNVNPYLVDNYNLTKYLKNIYSNQNTLFAAYVKSEFFIPKMVSVHHEFSDNDRLTIERARSGVGKRKTTVSLLNLLIEEFDHLYNSMGEYEYYNQLNELEKEHEFIYKAYFELGFETLDTLKYSKKKIINIMFEQRRENEVNYMLMIDKILVTFTLNIKIYIEDIIQKLQKIYEEFNFEKSPGVLYNAKGTDIEKYFDCKPINGKKKDNNRTYYRIKNPRFKLANDLKHLIN